MVPSHAGSVSRPDLAALTSLRFFAAAVVVAGHISVDRLAFLPQFVKAWSQSGYQAVTFFFVLSGFILVYVYSGNREEDGLNVAPGKFLTARLARIGPAYYLGLALMLPAFVYGSLVAGITPAERFAPAVVLVPTLLQAWYPPVSFSWNGPAWSLSVEVFFYLLFPLLMRATIHLTRARFLLFAGAAVIMSAAIRACLSSSGLAASDDWRYFVLYFPLFHLPSFVFGMALGRIYLFGHKLSSRTHAAFFGLGSVALMLLLGSQATLPPLLLTDTSLVPLYGLVIFGAARMRGFASDVLALPWLILLGEASYSIYILHTSVVFWWHWITRKMYDIALPAAAETVMVFGLVIALSIFVFAWFERPCRRWILQHANRPAKVAPIRA